MLVAHNTMYNVGAVSAALAAGLATRTCANDASAPQCATLNAQGAWGPPIGTTSSSDATVVGNKCVPFFCGSGEGGGGRRAAVGAF